MLTISDKLMGVFLFLLLATTLFLKVSGLLTITLVSTSVLAYIYYMVTKQTKRCYGCGQFISLTIHRMVLLAIKGSFECPRCQSEIKKRK